MGAGRVSRRGPRLLGEPLQPDGRSTYRARLGDVEREPAMGVTVQLMVDAEVSGVLFTCNPVSGDPSMVAVNASWGLGLGVVGGEVTPDEYLVSKVTGEVVRRQRRRPRTIEYRPGRGPGPSGARSSPSARDAAVPRRRAAPPPRSSWRAAASSAHFGGHQDVEWAIARTGAFPDDLYVLQSRPVTATPRKAAARAEGRVGDVADHGRRSASTRRSALPDGAQRRRRPRDPAPDRRDRARRAAHRARASSSCTWCAAASPAAGRRRRRPRRPADARPRPSPPRCRDVLPRGGARRWHPFVDVGAQVEPDTVVCIIEIMKMMNSVHAGAVRDDRRGLRRGRASSSSDGAAAVSESQA